MVLLRLLVAPRGFSALRARVHERLLNGPSSCQYAKLNDKFFHTECGGKTFKSIAMKNNRLVPLRSGSQWPSTRSRKSQAIWVATSHAPPTRTEIASDSRAGTKLLAFGHTFHHKFNSPLYLRLSELHQLANPQATCGH